jgi:hypothetical protein
MLFLKNGLKLEDSKRPEDMKNSDDPNYCTFHRLLGHIIEECWVFKARSGGEEVKSRGNNIVKECAARSCPA